MSLKCFDLKTDSVVTRRTFGVLPMPDRIVKQVNAWGMKSKREIRKIKLKFQNRKGNFFDWDNEELEDNENVEEGQENLIHPDVIDEIPGVELESDYENTMGTALLDDVDLVKDSIEQAAAAKKHFDMGKHNIMSHYQIKGVDDVIEIDSGNDSEEDDNDDSAYMPNLSKQEDVDSSDDDSDDESVGDNHEEVSVEDMIDGYEDISPPHNRGVWVRTQTKPDYIPYFSSKSYSRPGGVNLSQVESINIYYPDEDDFLKNGCHSGAGCKVKQGVIHVKFAENAEKPPAMIEEESNAHVMGEVLVEHYNMKKGLELFGERGEKAFTRELQKIHGMNTYKPMDVSKLSYQEIKYVLASMLFITKKRNFDLKSRKVAIGSKQRTYERYDNSNSSSPNVNTDSIFLTGLVDAY